MTISGLNTLFDYFFFLPTLFYQAVNISSADNFASNSCFRSLLYHRSCPCPLPYQAVNVSRIDKPTKRHSRSCAMSLPLSMSSQTSVSADIFRNHNPHPRYSYNFRHYLDIADSLQTINQELLQPKG